jgi:hypothetical protein
MTSTTERFNAEMAKQQAYQQSDEYLSQFCGTFRALPGSVIKGEFTIAINRKPNTTGPMRDFLLIKTGAKASPRPVRVSWMARGLDDGAFERVEDATEWTVCPRCETQIAIDDYQEAAGMCDACIIDTTPEPGEYVHVRDEAHLRELMGVPARQTSEYGSMPLIMGKIAELAKERGLPTTERDDELIAYANNVEREVWARMDDGFRKAQYLARAGVLALALLVGGTAAVAAQNPAVSDSELLYVSRHQNTDGTYSALLFPPIGTPAYSRSCYVQIAFEDHSAIAYCAEDGATYHFDADGQYVPNIPANPVREPGWYPAS